MSRLILLALLATPAAAFDGAKIDAAIRREMETQKLVGVSIGIIQNGKVVYTQGYGFADREKMSPMTAETITNWASNSKPLAAVLAMQLVEQGKLDLDADVRKYVPEFPKKEFPFTVRQILCHQSGMPHYVNGKVVGTPRKYAEAAPFMNPIHSLDKFNESPLIFEPGTKTSYSSYAYVLLSAAIQKAGGEPFVTQVRDRIAAPLKLSSFDWDSAGSKPNWSAGYVLRNGEVEKAEDEANDWKHGAGGFKSNVKDFARWAAALMSRELMKESTEKQMWTPQPLKDKTTTNWGLGVTLSTGKTLRVSHNGSQSETKTRMVISPADKSGIVIMSNCNHADVGKLAAAIEAALKP